MPDNPVLRAAFHWQYSGVVFPFLFGSGFAMVLAGHFRIAYGFFILSGIGMLFWWLTSEPLANIRTSLRTRKVRRDDVAGNKLQRKYRIYLTGGITIILVLTWAAIGWTRSNQTEVTAEQLKAHREDAYDHLEIKALPISVSDTSDALGVSITNGGHWGLAKHTFSCEIQSVINTQITGFLSSDVTGKHTEFLGLLGGGRGETAYCHPLARIKGPLQCVDMDVIVRFALQEQPDKSMDKTYRFFGRLVNDRFEWVQQGLNEPRDSCL